MTQLALRRQIKLKIDALPEERLQSANDYVEFLQRDTAPRRRPSKLERFKAMIDEAEASIAKGNLTPVSQLRRKR